jgi:hypothetical protein
MSESVRTTLSPAQLLEFFRKLPGAIAGANGDIAAQVRQVQTVAGLALLSKIQQSFLTRTTGARDPETGIQWAPLSPYTIARRKLGPADVKAVRLKAVKATLTDEERARFNKEYNARRGRLLTAGLSLEKASQHARAQTVQILRRSGANLRRKFDILAARQASIGVDTGTMLRSLSSGTEVPSGNPGQILETPPGKIIVGTRVPYAQWFHNGRPPRQPARPLWNEDSLPTAWGDAMLDAAKRTLLRVLAEIISRGHV